MKRYILDSRVRRWTKLDLTNTRLLCRPSVPPCMNGRIVDVIITTKESFLQKAPGMKASLTHCTATTGITLAPSRTTHT